MSAPGVLIEQEYVAAHSKYLTRRILRAVSAERHGELRHLIGAHAIFTVDALAASSFTGIDAIIRVHANGR